MLTQEESREIIQYLETALREDAPTLSRLREAIARESYCPDENAPEIGRLSAREREVFLLLAQGVSNQGIAGAIGVSIKTVDTHRMAIMRKMGFGNNSALVLWAAIRGYVGAPHLRILPRRPARAPSARARLAAGAS